MMNNEKKLIENINVAFKKSKIYSDDAEDLSNIINEVITQFFKKQKFEKIEKMAWKMYVTEANKYSHDRETCFANFEDCWGAATHFYDFAKEQEKQDG